MLSLPRVRNDDGLGAGGNQQGTRHGCVEVSKEVGRRSKTSKRGSARICTMQEQRVDAVATKAEWVVTVDGLGPLACILCVAKLVKTDELRSPVLSPAQCTLRASPQQPLPPSDRPTARDPTLPCRGAWRQSARRSEAGAQNVDNGGTRLLNSAEAGRGARLLGAWATQPGWMN